ncbi:vWA domain-containing protein [Ornithinibacillus halotolerans]|uniref:VWFA domain-containing protein n=1 Tax=Ornithinibacillus halotolerans TaxID=1274357 RepID=A0A916S9P0_9BACI|nr:VWA domain-containing protein [Ornithinibacillus halotolerans]GGA90065.1 hypothetical protein GCM10008025_35820 [Ornithinibacillus halotolerans]
MKFRQIFYIISLGFLLFGCSNDNSDDIETVDGNNTEPGQIEENESPAEDNSENDVNDELDTERFQTEDAQEIMQLEPGIYGEDNYDEDKVKEILAKLDSNLTGEEYYLQILALAADDYRDLYEQINQFDTSFDGPTEAPDGSGSEGTNASIEKEVNVAILLDASGSMEETLDGKTKMELAKEAIESFVSILPEQVNVSLQIYGNEGDGQAGDKEKSCNSTEVVYELAPYDESKFGEVLEGVKPGGQTPLAASISKAYDDIQNKAEEGAENIVYIVSDGLETCGGNPVEEAEKLNQSDMQAVVNIIGFDVDDEGQNELKKIADAGAGKYLTVKSQKEIEEFFNQEKRELDKAWLSWQSDNVDDYYAKEREKLNQVHDLKNKIYEKSDLEREKFFILSNYLLEELAFDKQIELHINQEIRKRYNAIQTFTRSKMSELNTEIRDKAKELRIEVRDRGEEGRE